MPFSQYSSGASRWGGSSTSQKSDPYSLDGISRQIENASLRAADSGYSTTPATRNWFEKMTNLPEGQNWFFDTLELLSRPGNAVKNVIVNSSMEKNQSVKDSLIKGISGRQKVSGYELAQKSGVDNPVGNFLLGTFADIALDPTTYIPGGVIAKGVKGGANLAAKPLKAGFTALENASPALKNLKENRVAPAIEATKDSLGFMFNPDYKKTETLTGGESSFLKDLERTTENSRKYMKENKMLELGNTIKSVGGLEKGIDVGRIMESPLKTLDELGKEVSRPVRELSSDPKITEAANNLISSNNAIREFASENGISIPELEGYMTHVWSREERALQKSGRVKTIDKGSFGTGNPNKKILNQRKLSGSVEDINEEIGRNFFEPNAFFATAIGQQRLIDYVHAVNFRRQVLSNADFALPYEKGMLLPKGSEVIDTAKYNFIKESGDVLEGMNLADQVGGKYVVTKQAKQLLDRYQRVNTDEGTKAFLRAYDKVQSFWKRTALFSAPYHVRNQAGAMFNNYVIGMNPVDLGKYTADGFREITNFMKGKESMLFKEFRQQGLSSSGLSKVEYAVFGREPEEGLEKMVKSMSKTGAGKAADKLLHPFETSREIGDYMDQANRFALYKWAREKKGMTPEQAAAKVNEAHFDYSNITDFERNVVTRLVPFWRWMRNNIPFQIRQFINDPRKYQNLNKIRLNAQEAVGLDEETIPDYMKEDFRLPVSGEDGKGKMLGLNLPLSDLTKLSSPLKTTIGSLTPLVKMPIELAINTDTFRGKPIQKFEGQEKQFNVPGIGEFGIPMRTAYTLEQATGQIGRSLSQVLQAEEDMDNKIRKPSMGISSMFKPFDAEEFQRYKQLDQLRQLQDLLLYIEQQEGAKPRTVNEIKKGSR